MGIMNMSGIPRCQGYFKLLKLSLNFEPLKCFFEKGIRHNDKIKECVHDFYEGKSDYNEVNIAVCRYFM